MRDGLRRMCQRAGGRLLLPDGDERELRAAAASGRRRGRDPARHVPPPRGERATGRASSCSAPARSCARCIAGADLLASDFGVVADVWSVTSFTELRRDGIEVERWNRLHPTETARVPFVREAFGDRAGPFVASTDYMRSFADQIREWVPGRYVVLGTDGFGRSDYRVQLRRFFEVDRHHVAVAALDALARRRRRRAVRRAGRDRALRDRHRERRALEPVTASAAERRARFRRAPRPRRAVPDAEPVGRRLGEAPGVARVRGARDDEPGLRMGDREARPDGHARRARRTRRGGRGGDAAAPQRRQRAALPGRSGRHRRDGAPPRGGRRGRLLDRGLRPGDRARSTTSAWRPSASRSPPRPPGTSCSRLVARATSTALPTSTTRSRAWSPIATQAPTRVRARTHGPRSDRDRGRGRRRAGERPRAADAAPRSRSSSRWACAASRSAACSRAPPTARSSPARVSCSTTARRAYARARRLAASSRSRRFGEVRRRAAPRRRRSSRTRSRIEIIPTTVSPLDDREVPEAAVDHQRRGLARQSRPPRSCPGSAVIDVANGAVDAAGPRRHAARPARSRSRRAARRRARRAPRHAARASGRAASRSVVAVRDRQHVRRS